MSLCDRCGTTAVRVGRAHRCSRCGSVVADGPTPPRAAAWSANVRITPSRGAAARPSPRASGGGAPSGRPVIL